MRYRIIPAKSQGGAFFVERDSDAEVMALATEARDSVKMTMVVVSHPPGELIRRVGIAEHVEPKPAKVKRAA